MFLSAFFINSFRKKKKKVGASKTNYIKNGDFLLSGMSKPHSIVDAIVKLDEGTALKITADMLEKRKAPTEILERCREGMSIIGERFQRGDSFLSEMIMAAEIFNRIMDMIRPSLKKGTTRNLGKVVIGTVEGDVHDIGKNIVIALLNVEGFEVIDLGVDVPPER